MGSRSNVETLSNDAGLTLGELSLMGETTEKRELFGGLVERDTAIYYLVKLRIGSKMLNMLPVPGLLSARTLLS